MSKETQHRPTNNRNSVLSMLSGIGWPALLGLATTSIFFVLIYRGPLNLPVMHRYFASHPVTFFETAFFFVGLAALLLKCLGVLREQACVGSIGLAPPPAGGQEIAECGPLLDELETLPAGARNSYLARRLHDALEFVERSSSASGLNDELKYLADVAAAQQQDSYALVRIVIWATPMLGFLGTVMGITEALGDLSANAKMLATSIDTAIQGSLGGLYVAFDTTALALTLSMILMFIQFVIDRIEMQLLSTVDLRASEELVGRFQIDESASDPHLQSVERMIQAVVRSTEQLVQRQAELWQGTISSAHDHWNRLFESVGTQMQENLTGALRKSLESHTEQLAQAEKSVAEQIGTQWSKVQTSLTENALLMVSQQTELARHGEVMLKVLAATTDVIKLEQVLNENLAALAGSKNFEDTVMSLSAAIHLLNTRLGKPTDGVAAVDLSRTKSQGKAA